MVFRTGPSSVGPIHRGEHQPHRLLSSAAGNDPFQRETGLSDVTIDLHPRTREQRHVAASRNHAASVECRLTRSIDTLTLILLARMDSRSSLLRGAALRIPNGPGVETCGDGVPGSNGGEPGAGRLTGCGRIRSPAWRSMPRSDGPTHDSRPWAPTLPVWPRFPVRQGTSQLPDHLRSLRHALS